MAKIPRYIPDYAMARKFRKRDKSLRWAVVYDLFADRYTIRVRYGRRKQACAQLAGQLAEHDVALYYVVREIQYNMWGF